jgi:PAS domain S-box-containing protein
MIGLVKLAVKGVALISSYLHSLQSRTLQAANTMWSELVPARPTAFVLLLLYCTYLLAAMVGQGLAIIPGIDITFWPPAGLMIGTLLLTRRASWPWWLLVAAIGELTANALWFNNPLHFTLLYVIGNASEVVVGTLLLTRLSTSPRIETLKDTLLFVVVAGVAPVVAATVIAFVDAFLAQKHVFFETWALVWLGDATGILAVTPIMIAAAHTWESKQHLSLLRLFEPVLILLSLLGIMIVSLHTWLLVAYATFPLLVWLAVRTKFYGAGVAIILLTITASYVTAHRIGIFAEPNPDLIKLRIVFLQAYLGISTLVALLVAALAQQYHETLAHLQEANRKLEVHVAQRTESLEESEANLQLALEAAEAGTWSLEEASGKADWDKRFEQAHGLKEDAPMTLETWIGAINPDDQKRVRDQLENMRTAPGSSQWETEYRVMHPELGERWMLSIGRAEYLRGGTLTSLAGICLDITFRKTHEERLRILMRESNHRKKNLLAVVMAIARHTVAYRPEDFLQRFQARIHSLATGYDLLINNAWKGVDLRQLIDLHLAHFKDLAGKRIFATGPDVRINASAVQPVGMALHELATNASKYGALSTSSGRVEITWGIEKSPGDAQAKDQFHLSWIESGGPPVLKPTRKGFGTAVVQKMIEMSLSAEVKIKYDRKGLSWIVVCPADQILDLEAVTRPVV